MGSREEFGRSLMLPKGSARAALKRKWCQYRKNTGDQADMVRKRIPGLEHMS
jgi:hypothetical protein